MPGKGKYNSSQRSRIKSLEGRLQYLIENMLKFERRHMSFRIAEKQALEWAIPILEDYLENNRNSQSGGPTGSQIRGNIPESETGGSDPENPDGTTER